MCIFSNERNDMYVLNAGTGTVELMNDAYYELSVYENEGNALFLGPNMGFPPRTERTSFPWGGGQPGL